MERAVQKKPKEHGLPARIKEYLNPVGQKNLEKKYTLIKGDRRVESLGVKMYRSFVKVFSGRALNTYCCLVCIKTGN